MISSVQPLPGFYLSTGYSVYGFGIGPATGQLAADLIAGDPPIVDLHSYRQGRLIDGTDLGEPGMKWIRASPIRVPLQKFADPQGLILADGLSIWINDRPRRRAGDGYGPRIAAHSALRPRVSATRRTGYRRGT